MRSPIFDQNHREQETSQRWTLQSDKMLRVALGPEVLAAHKRDFKCWQVSKVLGLEIATMAHAVAKTYSLPTHRIAA